MNHLQKRHLINFCKKHGLDVQLIDDAISYAENKAYLKSWVIKDIEEISSRECSSMIEQYEASEVDERYVVTEWEKDTPIILLKCYLRINHGYKAHARRHKVRDPSIKHSFLFRDYWLIEGSIDSIMRQIEALRRANIRFKVLRTSTKYWTTRNHQFIPKQGWVRKSNPETNA